MWSSATRQIARVATKAPTANFSVRSIYHLNKNSEAPLVELYRPNWPDPDFENVIPEDLPPLPPRTVPDHLYQFEFRNSSETGAARFYKHFMTNPADVRVKAQFYLHDMPLTSEEKKVLVGLLGPRLNTGNLRFKLTSEMFTNRVENCKYIMLLLENLLVEARNIAAKLPKHKPNPNAANEEDE